MHLTHYAEIKYNFIEKLMNVVYICCDFSLLKILNVNFVHLSAALHASIGFILLTTTAAPCVGFNALLF
jgi:hypothetical protein